ncbi:glycosyltransferase family 2 protein [uncultured Desulfuromonas sp.]|uniref:glycosyltransferase family 2 protein n=1 Tax=uncultured Desulfuromonas sp. TaxID=181013 RepID=UPI002AAB7A7D|nr:glycosyltransferase family 2 protein [uncultured Desulfuromonas sp.]
MQPKVTIVIVNWNKKDDVLTLLDSVSKVDYDNYQVVVIDNASTDDSVAAIRSQPLPVSLIENKENLGGTGGFNTGLKYALETLSQDYIWLLDNDAIVVPTALKTLVEVMEEDFSIALAGSKILNVLHPEKVVETGAKIHWASGNVAPLNQNCDDSKELNGLYDVDYVAICSALVRESALRKVGLMDQRYFLLWDDMDWGATFKHKGYRVVAVGASTVHHAAFTEKRSMVVDYYYGVRNPLLTMAKHSRGGERIKAFLGIMRRALYLGSLFAVTGRWEYAKLPGKAFWDFLTSHWGMFSGSSPISVVGGNTKVDFRGKSLLVLPLGADAEIFEMVSSIRKETDNSVALTLLIPSARQHLFQRVPVDDVLLVDSTNQNIIGETISIFFKLYNKSFDFAVAANNERITPFSFAVPKTYFFNRAGATWSDLKEGRMNLWKPAFAFLVGELLVWILLPFILWKASQYKNQQENA